MLLILIIVLIFAFGGGGYYYDGGRYRTGGYSLALVLFIALLIMYAAGYVKL